MQRKRAKPSARIAVRACLTVAAALVGAVLWVGGRESLLAWYWQHALTGTSGESDSASSVVPAANEILERLLTLGRPGLVAVVQALGHPSDDVSRAAYLVLDREISRWESSPPPDTKPLAADDLAKALADHIDDWQPLAKARAARLAMRILRRSPSATDLDLRELLAACNRVLHASDGVEPTNPAMDNDLEIADADPDIHGNEATNPQPSTTEAPSSPPAHHSMILGLADVAPPDLPRVANNDTDSAPLLGFARAPRTQSQNQRTGEVQQASYDGTAGDEAANAQRSIEASQRLRDLDAPALLAKLHEPNEALAAAAELEARGFSPRQIEVGKHLLSPDASERLRWIEAVPGIRGIDARYWLLRLSHDKNVHVRRAAISLLATDRNPEVIRRLQQAAIDEADPELRDQASRALEVLQSD